MSLRQPRALDLTELSTRDVARAYVALRQLDRHPGEAPDLPWIPSHYEVPQFAKSSPITYSDPINAEPTGERSTWRPPSEARLLRLWDRVKAWTYAALTPSDDSIDEADNNAWVVNMHQAAGNAVDENALQALGATYAAAPAVAHGLMAATVVTDALADRRAIKDHNEFADPLRVVDQLAGPGLAPDRVKATLEAVGDALVSRRAARELGAKAGLNLFDAGSRDLLAAQLSETTPWIFNTLEVDRSRLGRTSDQPLPPPEWQRDERGVPYLEL